ncbi:hypothetical protein D3C87_1979030 [compost metagenome]
MYEVGDIIFKLSTDRICDDRLVVGVDENICEGFVAWRYFFRFVSQEFKKAVRPYLFVGFEIPVPYSGVYSGDHHFQRLDCKLGFHK